MFVREKRINGYTYLYLVETVREDGRTKQRIIRNLGRKEAVLASGALDRLAASVGRFAERAVVLQAIERGDPALAVRRIGAPLLFGRLWEETGCAAVVKDHLAGRGFEFDVERAVFVAVLHRPIFHSSDAAIRGHVFCSFLALVLAKELKDRCAKAGLKPEWDRLIRDLDRLQSGNIERDGRKITVRTPVTGDVGPAFRAAGIALPHNIAEAPAA